MGVGARILDLLRASGLVGEGVTENRKLAPAYFWAGKIFAALFSAYYVYTAYWGIWSSESHRGLYFLGTLLLCFLLYPAGKGSPQRRPSLLDGLAMAVGVVALLYWIFQYQFLADHIGEPVRTQDFVFGLILLLMSLEMARRATGNLLPLLAILALLYVSLGHRLPGILGHPGASIPRIMEYLFITQSGMLGMVVEVFANYVLLFVILGAFLERSGLGALFFDLAYALTGHRTGGPGLTAVVSSAIYGMISGSGVANVVTTGTFTIPLMKRVGYRPHFAGAVEAAASSGGQYMPPVMGAGAFLLAEAAEVSYLEVVKIAFVPAVLYFLSVGLIVYFEAVKQGLHGVPREELPPLRKVLPRCYQLFPIVVVAYLLLAGRSAFYAAFWAIVWTVVLSWLRKDTRMGPREIFDALVAGAHNSLSIGALAGVLGIVIGSLILSGIQDRFASLLIEVSGGSLVITILLVIFAGYIFGMGVPVTAAYVMVAIVGVGALVRLGVPPLSAHLLCFWVAVLGGVTPPVALCAYAGASIAGADPLRTGFTATKLASWIFIMPFLFVYTPILFTGPPLDVVRSMLTAAVAAFAWAGALEGYLFRETRLYERVLLLVAALGLLHAGLWTDIVGVAAFAFVAITQRRGVPAARLARASNPNKGN